MADPGIIEAPGQTAGQRARAAPQQPAGRRAACRTRPRGQHRRTAVGRAGRLEARRGTSRRAAGRRRAGALALGDWYTFIQQIAQITIQPVEAGTREKQ